MISVSSFELEYNKVKKYFAIRSFEVSICPLCEGELEYRDSIFRNVKNMMSEARRFLLRRLRCRICGKLHRELPDIIQPYKHYESDVIQSVIDDSEDAEKCGADNSTIRRWKSEFAEAIPVLEQRLASIYARATEEAVPLEMTTRIIDGIKSKHNRWLPFVTGLLINCGYKICTEFAFFLRDNSAKVDSALKIYAERGRINVKTIKDTS
jgi:hypothetical protein